MSALIEEARSLAPVLAEPAARLQELRALTETNRIDWRRAMPEALARAGGPSGLAVTEWAEIPWYGVLDLWLHDPTISDVLVNGPDRDITIVRNGQRLATGVQVHGSWIEFAQRQFLLRGHILAAEQADVWPKPLMLGTTDRRVRFAATRPPASPDGPTLAIRLLPERWRTIDDFVREGVLPRDAAEMLIEALRCNVSLLIGGSTGSGKTTLAAALLQAIAEEKRVVIIEEARELPVLHDSVAVEVGHSNLSFAECVYFSLRQKPDLVVVGEVRGREGLAMLQAAATGHPGIATIHANDVQSALKNLERMACERGEVPPGIVRGMMTSPAAPMIVCHIGRYGGARRVGQIEEVLQLGAAGQTGERYPLNTLYQYDPGQNATLKLYPVTSDWGRGRF